MSASKKRKTTDNGDDATAQDEEYAPYFYHPGAILSHDQILDAIKAGDIEISPFDETAVGVASIDLRLSPEFRFYKNSAGKPPLRVTEAANYEDITERVVVPEGETYLLPPGQSCLGITIENVKIAPHLCGLLEGRSRFARLGLFVHITAGFMQPGINNRQVLEIYNASSYPLELVPGTRICQFIFMKMSGAATYKGRFSNQEKL